MITSFGPVTFRAAIVTMLLMRQYRLGMLVGTVTVLLTLAGFRAVRHARRHSYRRNESPS